MIKDFMRRRILILKKGDFMVFPSAIIHKPKQQFQDRWLDFFQLRVFNWIPEAMVGRHWKPKCPNCDKDLDKNGHSAEPRLVFDAYAILKSVLSLSI